jgi:uncharacterized protein (TIGR01777 family)
MTSQPLWLLIAAQIVMAAFDTLYHHELTEGLAWRPAQGNELALHAARSLVYALVFVALGFTEPHGTWAIATIAALAIELVITLTDFVEEDLTRKLPASERIVHTLLALNYGAILTLLLPVLLGWAAAETAVKPTFYGFWSILATLAASGALLFGARELAASRRLQRLVGAPAGDLVDALTRPHTVLLTGATGFIGSRLAQALSAAGHDVIALTRHPAKADALQPPFRLITKLEQLAAGTRIDAIVNLAGEPIADGLWTRAKRRRILVSRLRMTRDIVRLIGRLEQPPAVLVSGSAIGWYGLWQDEALTEFDGGKRCFTHRVCEAWEQMARRAQRLGVRVIRLRIGLVLGTQGGLLRRLLIPFEFGLGGTIGSGEQWMSWIERDDLVRLIAHGIATPQLTGPVNATAPAPVRNAAFTRALADALNRPAWLRFPAAILHRLAGDFADELLLGGQHILPAKAEASGFKFRYPTLAGALAGMLGSKPATAADRSVPRPESRTATTCLAAKKPATTTEPLASVVALALDSRDCIGETARGDTTLGDTTHRVQLARGPG